MRRNLHAEIMAIISEALSVSTDDLKKRLDAEPDDLDAALDELEQENLISRRHDSVRDEDFFAPTSKGMLQSRRAYKQSF